MAFAQKLDLGIVVTSSRAESELVIKKLRGGVDFSVLAKEKSVDASAADGDYLGRLDPSQLRVELQDALRGHVVGGLTEIVQVPAGTAVMKILPVAPATKDLDPKRISSLISTGAIRYGAPVSGFGEADAAMQDYPKPPS